MDHHSRGPGPNVPAVTAAYREQTIHPLHRFYSTFIGCFYPWVSWKPNANAQGLAGRAEATQVCSASRGPGQPLPAAREGLGLRGGSKNRDARRGLKDLFW